MPAHATAREALDAYGIDAVCADILSEASLTTIATSQNVSPGSLLAWIEADPERSARVREARAAMARVWDEKAERRIDGAADEFELKKAKELAHHFRWRASKVAPKEYGDRQAVEHSGSVHMTHEQFLDSLK
jgi:hypothetical protein